MSERVLKNCPPCDLCGIRDGVLYHVVRGVSICPTCHQAEQFTLATWGSAPGNWDAVKSPSGEDKTNG